jgi:uncharacterized protein (DUF952 family)
VNARLVKTELKFEEVPNVGTFPHVYGALNLDAVERVIDFEPNLDGKFVLPEISIA